MHFCLDTTFNRVFYHVKNNLIRENTIIKLLLLNPVPGLQHKRNSVDEK